MRMYEHNFAQVLSCSLLLYVSFCKAILVHCLLESRADEVSFSLRQCLFLPCCVRLPPTSHGNIQPTYWKWQSCNAMEIFTAMFKTQAARRETRPHHSGKVCCLPLESWKCPTAGKRGSSITNPIPLPISVMEGDVGRSRDFIEAEISNTSYLKWKALMQHNFMRICICIYLIVGLPF